jgi:hypothetical protein
MPEDMGKRITTPVNHHTEYDFDIILTSMSFRPLGLVKALGGEIPLP